jgi:hypothetical protein
MSKELAVHLVHLRKVVHRRKEHVDLDHLADVGARLLEHSCQVLAALLGHSRNRGLFESEDLALGCAGDLAGAVDRAGGLDGLGIWACRCVYVRSEISKHRC